MIVPEYHIAEQPDHPDVRLKMSICVGRFLICMFALNVGRFLPSFLIPHYRRLLRYTVLRLTVIKYDIHANLTVKGGIMDGYVLKDRFIRTEPFTGNDCIIVGSVLPHVGKWEPVG